MYKGRVRVTGFPQKTKSGFKTKKEATAWELRTAEKLKNPPLTEKKFTFYQVAELWLKNCVRRYKPKTCAWKANIVDAAIGHWGYDPYIEELSVLELEDFLNTLPGKTANRYKRELRTMFNFAIKREILKKNIAKDIEPYPEEKYVRYVPPAQDIEAVKSVADPLEYDILVIAYNTLARAGEIRNLRWEDIDMDKKEITLWTGKRTAADRKDDTLEMTNTLHEVLLRRSQEKPHKEFVLHRNGKKIQYYWINEVMTRLCKVARVNGEPIHYFSLHCIRHHVAALLSYKLSLIEISKILRHRNVTTDIYLRSLVTIKTKGIKVLDDVQKIEGADVISFQDAVNKR